MIPLDDSGSLDFGTVEYPKEFSKTIIILGDSHSRIWARIYGHVPFSYNKKQENIIPGIRVFCRSIMSASAQGLSNPSSKTNSAWAFLQYYKQVIANKNIRVNYVVFQLGNVDMDYVLHYVKKDEQRSPQEQIKKSTESLIAYINSFYTTSSEQKIIIGIQIPTLTDKQAKNYTPNCKYDHKQRTKLALEYNIELKKLCDQNKFHFLDINDKILNIETEVVDKRYINPDLPTDNHIHDNAGKFYAEELLKIVYEEKK